MKSNFSQIIAGTRLGLLTGATAIAITSLAFTHHVRAGDTPRAIPVALAVNDSALPHSTGFVTSFAPVVKSVAPSVVQINVSTKAKDVPSDEMGPDEMFRRFFGNQFGGGGGPGNRRGTVRQPKQSGLGSGVIVNKDGYILTNNHVVEDADTITVILTDGREFKAKVVGRDPKTDVAVIKVDAKNLPALTLADSDKIEVGDVCLAVGNPFGIGQTVTMGIISAKGRGDLGLGTDYEDFIQTDAAINPGNSGGALVDAEGRLIGINAAILSRSGGNQGIGFAIPINMARYVMENLIEHGKVVRGFLGVSIQDVTPGLAQEFKLPQDHGALVSEVSPKSPAEKAGIKSGDVIIEFNKKDVADSRHLRLAVADTAPGSTVALGLIRDGKAKTVDITVRELDGPKQVADSKDSQDSSNDALNGVTVSDLDAQARSQFQLPPGLKGAVITQVDEDSAAYEAKLRPGDVIEEINRQAVTSADDAVKLTAHVKDKVVLVKVWSKGGTRFVVVDESNSK